jgi:hypothetical protein
MTIKELLLSTAELVDEREIIEHGSIRCLWSQEHVDAIRMAEDYVRIGTGIVGDSELSHKLRHLAKDSDRIGDITFSGLACLESYHRGDDIRDYIDSDREDELFRLDRLIMAAMELV